MTAPATIADFSSPVAAPQAVATAPASSPPAPTAADPEADAPRAAPAARSPLATQPLTAPETPVQATTRTDFAAPAEAAQIDEDRARALAIAAQKAAILSGVARTLGAAAAEARTEIPAPKINSAGGRVAGSAG